MAGIPNNELVEQLNAFMRVVLELWTWDQLAALGQESHVEYRGPESNLLTFSLQLLDNETEGRPYLNVSVAVCDFRESGLGSGYEPLCNNFIYYKDGERDLEYKWTFAPNY